MSLLNGYSVISGPVTLIEFFFLSMDTAYQRDARMNIAVNQVNHVS